VTIQLRDRDIELDTGEFFVVPRGVEHCLRADKEAGVLLIEPIGTLNTGDRGGTPHRAARGDLNTRVRPCRRANGSDTAAPTSRKSLGRERGQVKRKPLPWVATSCGSERMVKRRSTRLLGAAHLRPADSCYPLHVVPLQTTVRLHTYTGHAGW